MKIAYPVFWAFLWILLNACEYTSPPTEKVVLNYPNNYRDSSQIDTIFSVPFHRSYQWMEHTNETKLNTWVQSQLALSATQFPFLTDSKTNSSKKELNFLSLPQYHQGSFFALARKGDQSGLFQGSDLSTKSTYNAYLFPESLPRPGLQILDFQLSDNFLILQCHNTQLGRDIIGIKNQDTDAYFWLDSISSGSEFQIIDQELYFLGQLRSSKRVDLYTFNLSTQELQVYGLPGADSAHYQIMKGQPDGNSILICEKERNASLSTWIFSSRDKKFERLFTRERDDFTFIGFQENSPVFAISDTAYLTHILRIGLDSTEDITFKLDHAQEQLIFQKGIFTGSEYQIIFSNLNHAYLYTLDQAGNLKSKKPLPHLLGIDHLVHYPDFNTSLIQYFSIPGGFQWLSYNENYPIPIEHVYQDLNRPLKEQISIQIDSLIGYDGIRYPGIVIRKKGFASLKDAPSLVLSINNQFSLLKKHPALSHLMHQFLSNGGIIGIPFPRGSHKLGSEWEIAGERHLLQLGYDDLQAFISMLNENKLGSADSRVLIGIGSGSLNAAALLVQRPDLVDKAILFDHFLDLLNHDYYPDAPAKALSQYGNSRDSIDFYYLQRYTPIQYPLIGKISTDVLFICNYPFIFANRVSTYKLLARLQDQGSPGKKLLWQENTYTLNNAYSLYQNFLDFSN